jgi:tetratricopeptide (TPR) repeat protein
MTPDLKNQIPLGLLLLFGLACQNRILTEADHYERHGQLDKAQIFLQRHLETHPHDAEAYFRLGELHGRMQQYDQMLSDFAAAEKNDGRLRERIAHSKEFYWRENFNQGVAALKRGEPEQAITPLRKAVLIFPERYPAYPALAAALLTTPDSSGALAVLEKARALNDDDLESRHALLHFYYLAGRNQQALQLCEDILKKSSHDLSALRCRALILQRQEPDKAETAFRELLSLSKEADDVLAFALHYYRHQRYDQAIPLFKEALERRRQTRTITKEDLSSPAESNFLLIRLGGNRSLPVDEIYRYLGDCAWHLGDYTAMAEWYTRVLQIHPNDLQALQNLLIATQGLGKLDHAEFLKKQLDKLTNAQE